MRTDTTSDREMIAAAFDAYDAACERLAELDFTGMIPAELFGLQGRREHRARTTAAVDHRILAALKAQATPKDIGARTAGGRTDITGLGLGCGWDNRLAYETDWTNTIGADGRIH